MNQIIDKNNAIGFRRTCTVKYKSILKTYNYDKELF